MTNEMIVTIICAVFASTGFWSCVNLVIQKRQAKTDGNKAERELLLGLAHDRLYTLCAEYIQRGYITSDEYDNLQYIARPYLAAGGNGTGNRLVTEVEKLPIRDTLL